MLASARGIEEVAPLVSEAGEDLLFVRQQTVVTTVEDVYAGGRKFANRQIGQDCALKPVAVQSPFAARIDETIKGQGLEDLRPVGAFAAAALSRRV